MVQHTAVLTMADK